MIDFCDEVGMPADASKVRSAKRPKKTHRDLHYYRLYIKPLKLKPLAPLWQRALEARDRERFEKALWQRAMARRSA